MKTNSLHTWFYFSKLVLILIVIAVLLLGTNTLSQSSDIFIIIPYLIIGYTFGMITCNVHSQKTGIWFTVLLFAGLNLAHSIIDGITLTTIAVEYRNLAISSHELIRQPALYVLFWSMLTPFTTKTAIKIILSLIAVTGIWMIGINIGTSSGYILGNLHVADKFLSLSIFIFIGDILHHLYDDFPYKKHSH